MRTARDYSEAMAANPSKPTDTGTRPGAAAVGRIPPIQCLLTFEALARLRSVTLAAEEQCVTPSAVSHRVRQLEEILGTKLFGRADFSLTVEGSEYLAHVREGLASLQKFPSSAAVPGKRKLRLAVTPTFSRSILIPRLRQFTAAYPEIDLTPQVSIPLLDVVAEDADLIDRLIRPDPDEFRGPIGGQ